jgi:O-antigen/teichoic acid export membrane protein
VLKELKRIFKDSLLYGLGGVLPKVISVLLVPLYTHFLSPSDYGVMSLAALLAALVGQILLLGLVGSVARFCRADSDPETAGSLLFSVLVADLVFSGVLLAVLLAFGPRLFDAIGVGKDVPFNPYLAVAFAGAFLSGPIALLQGVLRTRGMAPRFAVLAIVSFGLNAAFTVYFVAFAREGALGSLKGTTYAAAIVGAYSVYAMWRWVNPRFSWPLLGEALAFGLPLVPHAFAGWLIGYADRYVLQIFRTSAEVGLYSLAYSIGMGMSVIAMAVNMAWVPTFYDLASSEDGAKKLPRLTTVYAGVITVFGVAFLLVSHELTQLLATRAYWGAASIAPIVVAGYYVQAMYFVTSTPMFFMKRTRLLAITSCLAAAVNVVANFLLVPRWGMYAAAWATVGSFAVMMVGSWTVSSRLRPRSFEHRRLATLVSVFAAAVALEQLIGSAGLSVTLAVGAKAVVFLAILVALFLLRVVTRAELARVAEVAAARVGRASLAGRDSGDES